MNGEEKKKINLLTWKQTRLAPNIPSKISLRPKTQKKINIMDINDV